MESRPPEPPRPPLREEPGRLKSELDELACREADLARGLDAVLAGERYDADGFARLITCRSAIAERRLGLMVRWMALLDRRLRDVEARLGRLSGEVDGHEEALKLLCEALKTIDDPYGFGLSLDERIFGEAWNGPLDDPED